MDIDLVKAIFAVYVVGGSLIRILDDNELFRLTAINIWGRSQGLLLHFLSNIAMSLFHVMIYFCRGTLSVTTYCSILLCLSLDKRFPSFYLFEHKTDNHQFIGETR